MPAAASRLIHAKTWVHYVIKHVDDQIDDNKEKGNQDQIGRHDGNIHDLQRLQEQLPHAGPLEYCFCDNGKGNQRTQL